MNREEDIEPIRRLDPQHVEELAHIRCGNPECDDPTCSAIFAIIPRCHPRAGTDIEYHKDDGTLRLGCAFCRRPIITFQVASLPKEKKQ